jgi:hypothetical protein
MFISITRKANATKGDTLTATEIRKFLGVTRFEQYRVTQIQVESYRGKADSYIAIMSEEEHNDFVEELTEGFKNALSTRTILEVTGTFIFVPCNTEPDLFSGAVSLAIDEGDTYHVKKPERGYW